MAERATPPFPTPPTRRALGQEVLVVLALKLLCAFIG